MEQLLKLSLATQIALGSGYVAYCCAYLGIRSHHKAIDVTLSTLGFSLIATLILSPAPQGFISFKQPALGIVASVTTIACGLAWRGFVRGLITKLLRKVDICWTDDMPSALASIVNQEKYNIRQIEVLLEDGQWLHCTDTSKFYQSPFGPCSIGEMGDLGLYVTKITESNGDEKIIEGVVDREWGDRITYVPASKVKRIEFRYSKRPTFWASKGKSVVMSKAAEQTQVVSELEP